MSLIRKQGREKCYSKNGKGIFIYGLVCPTTGRIRYVGQTSKNPYLRLKQHLRLAVKGKTHKDFWLTSLSRIGKIPSLVLLEECSVQNLDSIERKWISCIPNLTNSTKGGEGALGLKREAVTEEVKRKISKKLKGRKVSNVVRNNMSCGQTGKKVTDAHRNNISEARLEMYRLNPRKKGWKRSEDVKRKISKSHIGIYHSEESKIKMSKAHKGKKLSEETKKRMSEAQKKRHRDKKI